MADTKLNSSSEASDEDTNAIQGENADVDVAVLKKHCTVTLHQGDTITFECSDGMVIDVNKNVLLRMSQTIRTKLEQQKDGKPVVFQLENITGRALSQVLDYCRIRQREVDPQPEGEVEERNAFTDWDDKLRDLDPGLLCELASVAYHLKIKPLVDLTCQAIAQLLKGKSPAEIRRTFNILYDFTPEDDAPPPTTRDKLRSKLCDPNRRKRNKNMQKSVPKDPRPISDLMAFIEGDDDRKTKNQGKKKRKPKKRKKKDPHKKKQGSDSPAPVTKGHSRTNSESNDDASDATSNCSSSRDLSKSQDLSDDMYTDTDFDNEDMYELEKELEEFRKRLESVNAAATKKMELPTIVYDSIRQAMVAQINCGLKQHKSFGNVPVGITTW